MGGADIDTLGQRFLANHSQRDGLVVVIVVDLVAGLGIHAGDKGLEAQLFRFGNGPGSGFPFGLACVHEGHVALDVGIHILPLLGGEGSVSVFGGPDY